MEKCSSCGCELDEGNTSYDDCYEEENEDDEEDEE